VEGLTASASELELAISPTGSGSTAVVGLPWRI
jgi:hypothetical protein